MLFWLTRSTHPSPPPSQMKQSTIQWWLQSLQTTAKETISNQPLTWQKKKQLVKSAQMIESIDSYTTGKLNLSTHVHVYTGDCAIHLPRQFRTFGLAEAIPTCVMVNGMYMYMYTCYSVDSLAVVINLSTLSYYIVLSIRKNNYVSMYICIHNWLEVYSTWLYWFHVYLN